jgi:hypothetical protein
MMMGIRLEKKQEDVRVTSLMKMTEWLLSLMETIKI